MHRAEVGAEHREQHNQDNSRTDMELNRRDTLGDDTANPHIKIQRGNPHMKIKRSQARSTVGRGASSDWNTIA